MSFKVAASDFDGNTFGDKKICTAVNFTTHDAKLPANIFDGARKIFGNYPDEKNFLRATEAVIYEF